MPISRRLILKNCQLYNQQSGQLTDILIENGQIVTIGTLNGDGSSELIDADGKILAPGFIDIHIQGAGGCDILDASKDSLHTMSQTLARFGVTGFLATTVMNPDQDNKHLKILAKHWNDDLGGARILGLHLEGPFINPEKRGGIALSAIYPISDDRLNEIFDITGDSLRMMTIAPEFEDNRQAIDQLIRRRSIPSFGHSNANYQQVKDAFAYGINHVTHIFNAMLPLHHREPGPLLAILESEKVTVQIICDGVHLHPRIVQYLYKTIGIDRCICITDGIQAIGLPEGKYRYNNRDYISKGGAARYEDGTLIGTALALNQIGARFQKFTSCSLEEAINSISLNPARLLGLDGHKGSIEPGKDADLVVMTLDFTVDLTMIGGNIIFEKNEGKAK